MLLVWLHNLTSQKLTPTSFNLKIDCRKLERNTTTINCVSFVLCFTMQYECRICLKTTNSVLDIFFDDLPTKIEEISSIEILPDYGFSSKICDECVENVYLFHNFRDQIIKSNAAWDGKVKEIQNKNSLQAQCRMCLIVSENATDLFCNGLPHKIEIISLLEILQDVRFPSKICTECEKRVHYLYDFRTAIIKNNAIVAERHIKIEKDVNIEDIKLEDDTLQLNEYVRNSSSIVTPISQEIVTDKKKTYMYKCLFCKYLTPSYISWQSHNRSHEETNIVCEVCGKLINNTHLSVHLMSHSTKKVPCPICGQILKHEITLRIHLKRHNKAHHFQCSECGKLYKSRSSYRKHLDGHKGQIEKNFKCSLCDRRFYDKSRLDVHFRSHTGERPYLCDVCNKGFSSTNALKTHIRQHTQEKPYTCRYCDAAFKQAVLVRRHMKSKHPEKVVEKSNK